jgi:hypothetical protein
MIVKPLNSEVLMGSVIPPVSGDIAAIGIQLSPIEILGTPLDGPSSGGDANQGYSRRYAYGMEAVFIEPAPCNLTSPKGKIRARVVRMPDDTIPKKATFNPRVEVQNNIPRLTKDALSSLEQSAEYLTTSAEERVRRRLFVSGTAAIGLVGAAVSRFYTLEARESVDVLDKSGIAVAALAGIASALYGGKKIREMRELRRYRKVTGKALADGRDVLDRLINEPTEVTGSAQ